MKIETEVFGDDPVYGAKALQDFLAQKEVWTKFYHQPNRSQDESGDDYELRCEADFELAKIAAGVALGESSRTAVMLMIKNIMESGAYVASTLIKTWDGPATPGNHLKAILDFCNISESWGDYKTWGISTYLTEVLPELRRHNGVVSDESYAAIVSDNGAGVIPKRVREAVQAVQHARKGAGVTQELAQQIAASIDGDEKARASVQKIIYGREGWNGRVRDPIEIRSQEMTESVVFTVPLEYAAFVEAHLRKIADIKPY